MPPTEKVSAAAIVHAAVKILEHEGMPALTARRVASELGASTAPVYRSFDSMDALADAAMEQALDQLLRYTAGHYTDRPFLNMGIGIALFAREHPRLYQTLFLQTDRFEQLVKRFLDTLTEHMQKDARFAHLDRRRRTQLLNLMWTYTHGLASLIAVGLAKETSKDAIIRSLETVGTAVIKDRLSAP